MTGSQVLELSCERMSYGPDAVARDAGGRTVFVSGGVAGDRVRAVVDREEERWAHATVVEVVDPSSHRVLPACPFAGACGGCPWQHLSYEAQLQAKRANVRYRAPRAPTRRFEQGYSRRRIRNVPYRKKVLISQKDLPNGICERSY